MTGKNSQTGVLTYVSFEPLRQGHASYTHVIEIIEGLQKQGWTVNLIAPVYKSTNLPSILARLFTFLKIWLRVLFSPKPDVYYARMHFAGYVVSLIGKLKATPCVVEVNGPFEDLYIAWPSVQRFRLFFDALMRGQMGLSSAVISVTPGLQSYSQRKLARYKKQPIYEVVTNGANTQIFKPLEQLPKEGEKLFQQQPYAAFYGTFAPWQGLDKLLAAAQSSFWPDNLQLLLAGDGAMRPLVEKATEQHDHITYLGRIDYKDMPHFVAGAELSFVITQDTDGRGQFGLYPLKLFEAMAAGVPVITTLLPGQSKVVTDEKCGIIIKNSQPEEICRAVKTIATNDKLSASYGKQGRQAAERTYNWAALAERTHEILLRTLKVPVSLSKNRANR